MGKKLRGTMQAETNNNIHINALKKKEQKQQQNKIVKHVQFDFSCNRETFLNISEEEIEKKWYQDKEFHQIKCNIIDTLNATKNNNNNYNNGNYCLRGLEPIISNDTKKYRRMHSIAVLELLNIVMILKTKQKTKIIQQQEEDDEMSVRELKLAVSAINKITEKQALRLAMIDSSQSC